jgi:tRNA modification GTPase
MRDSSVSRETIAAPATPRGSGAIAIVRLSGEDAVRIASELVRDARKLREQKSHHIRRAQLLQADGTPLDEALCAVYRAPRSYTGENMVEFFLHASPFIVSKTLERCCQAGARIAKPGEFTLRAFLNGKMDLAQAEAVADLVASASERAHRAAIRQRGGALSDVISGLREQLIEILSRVELEIDFTDQGVDFTEQKPLQERLQGVITEATKLAESFQRGRLYRDGAVVVIAGPPNVGKSTLFNALLNEERALVHESPGTTRDAIEALVEWEGLAVRLLDTAGQAEGFSDVDAQAVARARKLSRNADLVLWTVNVAQPETLEPPAEIAAKVVIVGNKADLLPDDRPLPEGVLRVSALRRTGLETLKRAAVESLFPPVQGSQQNSEGLQGPAREEAVLTRERHYEAVRRALACLERARDVADRVELFAFELREANESLSEVIGEVTKDDILNRIFADFCIGK